MSTEQQIAANRRNAKKSTGPRSPEGKALSRQNALKHGLTAEQLLLANEDPVEYGELRQAVFIDLAPQGALQTQLAERVASLLWRLRRVPVFETALVQWIAHVQLNAHDSALKLTAFDPCSLNGNLFADGGHLGTAKPEVLEFGRMVETLLKTGLSDKVGRYESNLQRELSATLRELRELQATRQDPPKLIEAAE